jgi:hypothetical protein
MKARWAGNDRPLLLTRFFAANRLGVSHFEKDVAPVVFSAVPDKPPPPNRLRKNPSGNWVQTLLKLKGKGLVVPPRSKELGREVYLVGAAAESAITSLAAFGD